MKIENLNIETLIPYARNPRKNDAAVDSVAASIQEFGFQQPIVLDKDRVVVVGHTRLLAAKKLGLKTVPCVIADNLTPEKIKAYRLLDNKLAEKATWDYELLELELKELPDFDMGFFQVEWPVLGEEGLSKQEEVWQEMPEFRNEAKEEYQSIIVHFESESAANEFKELIGQDFNIKTKYIYHPKQIKIDTSTIDYEIAED